MKIHIYVYNKCNPNIYQLLINRKLLQKKIFELSSHDYKLFWNKIIISDFPE